MEKLLTEAKKQFMDDLRKAAIEYESMRYLEYIKKRREKEYDIYIVKDNDMEKWIAVLRNESEDITVTSREYNSREEAERFANKITNRYSGFNESVIYSSKSGVEEKPITERIKTYVDACNEMGIPIAPPRISEMRDDELAYYKLKVITKVLNEGWKPDWRNNNERKYFPCFNVLPLGASCGLDPLHSTLAWTYSPAHIGSHLVYKSQELAEYAAAQFKHIYEDFLLQR